ncbi:hypothetical protein [Streptomyces sp900129855]|uniref:Uncharacterized protein n=1 Tax=Streptomyces sp. 900129855 TaxID=3155129 RepID=A0ABV2ZAN5_9ACTN
MSAQEERAARAALRLPPALYDHALHLVHESPDGLPSGRGFDLPDVPDSPAPSGEDKAPLSRPEAAAVIAEALHPLPDDPAALHRRFAELGVWSCHRYLIRSTVADLPLPADQHAAARTLARGLTRTGTTVPAVIVGLALLTRLGEPEDVPYLSTLGLLRALNGPAVQALDTLDRRSAAVVDLVVSTRRAELRSLVRALAARDGQAVRRELVAFPAEPRLLGPATARRVAEAALLPDLLAEHPADTALLARAGRLLVRMASARDEAAELLAYRDATGVYETVVSRAGLLPPTLQHHAMLLSLALGLSSGTGALLDWPTGSGRRETLLASLGRLLAEPSWTRPTDLDTHATHDTHDALDTGAAARRLWAGWIRRTGRRPFSRPAGGRLRIEVVAGDPVDREPVETRILLDGRPLVPAVFPHGPAHSPERLLDDGLLRAGPEPRRVQLAEASCTEGCCGALHVTIRRDGDQVVWQDWERPALPDTRGPAPELPARRFDAAAYDAEIARAEADREWSWPARTVARLIKAGLAARPELLARWDARPGWIGSGFLDPDTAVVTFWYAPGLGAGEADGDALQFRWVVPDDGAPPEEQAAAALRRLAEEDPRTYARFCGGTRERAEQLGYPWPPEDG